jgi:triacylglycerol lipase
MFMATSRDGTTRAQRKSTPRVRAPIVLVHGLMGFDAIKLGPVRLASYFPGVEAMLRAAGNRVFMARVSPTAGVAHRAAELREFLNREVPRESVHVFAHSMGGLDARYMISRLGMEDRVLTLTTIGTPHRGSAFADWGIRRLERVVKPLLRRIGIPDQAFYDLTTEQCRAFNEAVPDVPTVRYASVAGRCTLPWLGLEWLLPHSVIRWYEGANDGLVSVASATYGERTDVWEGDHLSLINWPNPQACTLGVWRSRQRHYADLVRRLADAEF